MHSLFFLSLKHLLKLFHLQLLLQKYLQKLLKRYTPKKQRINPTLDEVTPIKIEFENKRTETLYEDEQSYFDDDPLFEDLRNGPQCAQQ